MAEERDNEQGPGVGVGVVTKTAPKTKRPSLYKVILLNDDYTPQEFVVWLLQAVFKKEPEEAIRIMLHVHQTAETSTRRSIGRFRWPPNAIMSSRPSNTSFWR